ncbi:MAG: FGGY family carbohydrate kinase [Bacteroidota bacterium]
MLLLGYDIGSSSVKAALWDTVAGQVVGTAQSPQTELPISAPHANWAEQDPELWWQHLCLATQQLLAETQTSAAAIGAIGISYQMHGLVLVDENQKVLRPAIIWCDSRAITLGDDAFHHLGEDYCLTHLLNSPGNFTAAKLAWVKQNEPDIYERATHFLLPGDYIAMRLTGTPLTTFSGLSEGILWDFSKHQLASNVLDYFQLDEHLVPPIQTNLSNQGTLTEQAAQQTGLCRGIPVTYRAGDQPNNALAMNVLHPGEVAATGGTSGVIYGVVDHPVYDSQSRVNSFLHANHQPAAPRIGVLLCINGAGSQYSWVKQNLGGNQHSYSAMNEMADAVPVGADGLRIWPFGNGAERMLANQNPGARMSQWHFNRQTIGHVYRAALEGIAFSFVYGARIMQQMGLDLRVMRVGNDNLFRSAVFSQTIANLLQCKIEVLATTGAVGAARAAGVVVRAYGSLDEATEQTTRLQTYGPAYRVESYRQAYDSWLQGLNQMTPQPSAVLST